VIRLHREVTAVAVAALALLPWRAAEAQKASSAQFGISAGLNIPLSDLSRTVQTGFGMNGFMAGRPQGWPVSLRGELSYSSFAGSSGRGGQSFTAISMDALYPMETAGDTPYFVGGLGLDHTSSYVGYQSENDLGINFGGGYRWRRPDLSYFVEARYVYVGHSGPARQMLPITFGVIF
jgi:hypothetical protein